MIVWVSGPTGSGKTTLTDAFGDVGYSVVPESLPKEAYGAFMVDPTRHCALLQEEIMLARYDAWNRISSAPYVVFDRSIDEDANIFCKMHVELGLLDGQQFEKLLRLSHRLQTQMPKPDLIVFMSVALPTLEERVTELTHPRQIVRALERQVSLYREWLAGRREDIIKLDNSACRPQAIQKLLTTRHVC